MSEVLLRCPECGTTLTIPQEVIGRRVKCPKCQNIFVASLPESDADVQTAPQAQFGQEPPPHGGPGRRSIESTPLVTAAPAPGTGGRTPNADLMRQARQSLSGRWGLAVAAAVVYVAITLGLSFIPYVSLLVNLLVLPPLSLGLIAFFLSLSRKGEARIESLFYGYRQFGAAVVANVLIGIFVFLWALLLIIPGIIAAYAYSLTFFIIADDPSVGGFEAISRSKKMMQGKKWKLFCLHLRFIGWALLCCLTLGIGFLWLVPYMQVSVAQFYDDLQLETGIRHGA